MSKQDRQGVRTAADLERKYALSKIDKAYDQASRLPAYISQALDSIASELLGSLSTQLEAALENYAKKEDYQGVIDFLNPYDSWIPLTVASAFTVGNNDDSLKPVFKATGNVVTVCGVVSNVSEMTSTSSGVVFASGIPEEFRPHMEHHFVCQGSGMNRWLCTVKTDGTLMLSRYGTTSDGTIAANSWLPFTCTYQI